MTEQLFKKTLKALIDNKAKTDKIESSLQSIGLFDVDEPIFLDLGLTLSEDLINVMCECNPFGIVKEDVEEMIYWYVYEGGEKRAVRDGKEYNLSAIDDFINYIKRLK
jgi:hypothetical protein